MEKNFKESNLYIILFAMVMVLIVGSSLAFLNEFLKPNINRNIVLEKKENLLQSLGIHIKDISLIEDLYSKYIIKELAIDYKGNQIIEGKKAFDIDITKEIKIPLAQQRLPLYLAKNEKNQNLYIIPLIGNGLWDAIWGYISLDENLVIKGVSFDHKGETPGLGAEIKENYFQSDFVGEKILDKQNNFVGINIKKNNGDPKNENKEDNTIDAISGATITSVGVSDMIKDRVALYMPYLNKLMDL